MTSTADSQQQLQTLSDQYQSLQNGTQSLPPFPLPPTPPPPILTPPAPTKDLQTQISHLHRLESQQTENTSVRSILTTHASDSAIYKLVGPVLLKQEKAEAESAVEGRLEFIGNEMKRVEKVISEMQEQSEGKKMEVYQLQMKMQEGK